MVRRFSMAVLLAALAVSAVAQSASAPVVVSGADLKKIVPEGYFFRGMSATVQMRNSAAVKYPDGFFVMAGLVDTSGYSSAIAAKYNGFFITEKKLAFGSQSLPPGQYGMGYTPEGKFHILNVAGDELLVSDLTVDDKIAHPVPLKMVVEVGQPRLYLGKKYVTFTAP